MNSIYNKEALNRIASQDKLDNMIVLVSPRIWISIIGAFIIIAVLGIWGFYGKLPTNVDSEGIYINSAGTARVYSETDGFITNVYVKKGDVVTEDQILATVGSEDDIFNIQQMDSRIQYVENMSFDSELDVVTSDTEQLAEIKLTANSVFNDAEQTKAGLELKKEKLEDAKTKVQEEEQRVLEYKELFYESLSITDQSAQLEYQEADSDYENLFARYESAKNQYISATENYNSKQASFNAKYADFDPEEHSEEEVTAYETEMEEVNSLRMQSEDYKYFMDEEEQNLKNANNNLDTARTAYLEYINEVSDTAVNNTIASTEYTEALQDYATAKANYKALSDEVDDLELKLVMDEGMADENKDNYRKQFDNQKSAVLSDLYAQREVLLNQAEKATIRSSVSGEVFDIPVSVGSVVGVGTEVISVLKGDLDKDSIVCFVPIADAKKLKEGMKTYIYPSTVDKQEYGHIDGTVEKVEQTVATENRMKEILGNDSLVAEFEKNGPVCEVWFSMEEDNTSVSGYHWNTNKGNEIDFTTGTVVATTIITEEKRPIDILIPYLKHKLDFEDTENEMVAIGSK